MIFLKEGKTNVNYICIVVILAAIIGGGILTWQYWFVPEGEVEGPEEVPPEKVAPAETEKPIVALSDYYVVKIPSIGKQKPADFSILRVNQDGSSQQEIYKGQISYWYTLVTDPPKISPDGRFLYITHVGIFDIAENRFIKSKGKKCAWFSGSKKLGCIESVPVEGIGTNHKISILGIDGKEEILREETVNFEDLFDPSKPHNFFNYKLEIIGIRNQMELIFSTMSQKGFVTFNIATKQFDWIYEITDRERNRSGPWAVYSPVADKITYLSLVDRQEKYGVTGKERYLNRLITVDVKTGKTETLWTTIGFNINPLNLHLSRSQKKIVFQTNNSDFPEYTDVYYIYDFPNKELTEIIYKFPSPAYEGEAFILHQDPKLLGFTGNEKGVLVFELNSKEVDATGLRGTIVEYVSYIHADNGKAVRLIENECYVDFLTSLSQPPVCSSFMYTLSQ